MASVGLRRAGRLAQSGWALAAKPGAASERKSSRPAFESMKPLSSEPLKIAPDGNFLLEKSLLFKTGLYYYLIEDEESGNWLFVGKFMM